MIEYTHFFKLRKFYFVFVILIIFIMLYVKTKSEGVSGFHHVWRLLFLSDPVRKVYSSNTLFQLPLPWFITTLLPVFLLFGYSQNELNLNSCIWVIRYHNWNEWWRKKYILIIQVVLTYYIVILLLVFFYCVFMQREICCFKYDFMEFVKTFILPLIYMMSLCLFDEVMLLFFQSIFGLLVILIIQISSVYYDSFFLPGNFSMLIRTQMGKYSSRIVVADILINLVFYVLIYFCGKYKLTHQNR